jgi:hypothetical protein
MQRSKRPNQRFDRRVEAVVSPSLSSDGYRIAEVCRNGHVSTSNADEYPDRREKFCSKCGEVTITHCSGCKLAIRGSYVKFGMQFAAPDLNHDRYSPPAFCFNCGQAFPWTEIKIAGAMELLETTDIPAVELQQFRDDLTEATKDTPKTAAASARIRKVLGRVGSSVASAIRDITVDILSEAAKKAIWG